MTAPLHTAAETAAIREKVINHYALLIVKRVFAKYPQIKSAYFAVAQYWDDGASDEVHNFFVYSVLNLPNWEAFAKSEQAEDNYENWEDYDNSIKDPINLPGFVDFQYEIDGDYSNINIEKSKYYFAGFKIELIAAFAAFCKEGSHQCMDYSEAYTPYTLFTRTDTGIKTEIVGKMLRPWLDGISPEDDY